MFFQEKPRYPVEGQDGNWKCAACETINFASRTECHRCKAPYSRSGPMSLGFGAPSPFGSPMPGMLPQKVGISAPIEGYGGNWRCTTCANVNFAKRDVCNRCNAPRPPIDQIFAREQELEQERALAAASGATIQTAGVGPGRNNKFVPPVAGIDGNWECFSCMSINFASREHCHRCSAARPPQDQIKRRAEQIKAERAVQLASSTATMATAANAVAAGAQGLGAAGLGAPGAGGMGAGMGGPGMGGPGMGAGAGGVNALANAAAALQGTAAAAALQAQQGNAAAAAALQNSAAAAAALQGQAVPQLQGGQLPGALGLGAPPLQQPTPQLPHFQQQPNAGVGQPFGQPQTAGNVAASLLGQPVPGQQVGAGGLAGPPHSASPAPALGSHLNHLAAQTGNPAGMMGPDGGTPFHTPFPGADAVGLADWGGGPLGGAPLAAPLDEAESLANGKRHGTPESGTQISAGIEASRIVRGMPLRGGDCAAWVTAGGLVYVSQINGAALEGLTEGCELGASPAQRQMVSTLANLEAILTCAGTSKDRILEVSLSISDPNDVADVQAVWATWVHTLEGQLPAKSVSLSPSANGADTRVELKALAKSGGS